MLSHNMEQSKVLLTAYLQVLARNLGFTWVYGGREKVASYNARIHHIRLAAGTTGCAQGIPVTGGHGHRGFWVKGCRSSTLTQEHLFVRLFGFVCSAAVDVDPSKAFFIVDAATANAVKAELLQQARAFDAVSAQDCELSWLVQKLGHDGSDSACQACQLALSVVT